MGRVTIRQIMYECTQNMSPDEYAKMQKILDIEITPRRAIEMIIEKCNRDEEIFRNFDWNEAAVISHNVKVYAETLLKQFEEDNNV